MGERGTPRLTAEQVVKLLRQFEFSLTGQSGSHQKWRNPSTGRQVIVPYHRGRILPLGTMKSIIEGSGVPRSAWPD
ncbi:MAG: type II toxin-antitoxin system HicA family toxin [Bryobacterales bacterium]|nr:type II toxin-antitoxin system HicA family toxin [Bryobacterales bacterium]